MIPYGKDNWRRNADTQRGEWLAARGFALCRLDVRGTGSSPGVAEDEYTEAETHDGYDAVEWLAAQPWCNGNVGMWGISYGGFTALQVAKLRPPHLRAILPMYATDDRYRDDVHIRGGCVTASEKCQYAVSQLGMNAMPPHPPFRGDAWRDEWRARLEATPPWLLAWVREQTDGPYWRRGSLAPDYDALTCAVFQVAGWTDAYPDAAFRIQERCRNAASVRTLVGNWVHSFPDDAYPGPNLDWNHELVRFFDRYLKGRANGWEDEPALVWFEHDYADPEPFPVAWPGRWRAAAAFPVPGTTTLELALDHHPATGDGLLRGGSGPVPDGSSTRAWDPLPHRATAGTSGPLSWGAGGSPNGLARDLRPDEARGLTYTTAALGEAIAIIGVPEAVLHVQASMPIATCVVRLSEVNPDGVSALVATGVLNLTHRASDTEPSPMPAGRERVEEVHIPLRTTGHRFTAGNRIRLTILSSYWPVLWPSPQPGELRVFRGRLTPSRLVLPVLSPTSRDPPRPGVPHGSRRHAGGRHVHRGRARVADRGGRPARDRGRDDLRWRGQHPGGRFGPLQQRAAGPDGLGRRPGPCPPRERRGLPLDRSGRRGCRHPRPRRDRLRCRCLRRRGRPRCRARWRALLRASLVRAHPATPGLAPPGPAASRRGYGMVERAARAITADASATDTLASVPNR